MIPSQNVSICETIIASDCIGSVVCPCLHGQCSVTAKGLCQDPSRCHVVLLHKSQMWLFQYTLLVADGNCLLHSYLGYRIILLSLSILHLFVFNTGVKTIISLYILKPLSRFPDNAFVTLR